MPKIESIVIHSGPQGPKGDPSLTVGPNTLALGSGQYPKGNGTTVVASDFAADVAATPGGAAAVAGSAFVPSGGDIQAGIDAAAGTKKVLLGPGTFSIRSTVLMRAAHSDLTLEALVPGTTTLKIDDTGPSFAGTSGLILNSATPAPVYSETGRTDVVPSGTTEITVTDASALAVGQLVQLYPTTIVYPNLGEIRTVLAINGTTVRLNAPLYRDNLTASGWQLRFYAPRTCTLRGLIFDSAPQNAGHAGVQLASLTRVLAEDCQFIGGGQHGIYSLHCANVTYRRCHAENMVMRDAGWTPERAGESAIPASRGSLAGEGYGLAYEAFNVNVESCTFRRNRHHISGAGDLLCSAHVRYSDCHGSEDLQGAFDMHPSVDYGVIEPSCTAERGWAGLWLRGRFIKGYGTYRDEASDGARMLDYPSNILVDITTDRCGYHARAETITSGAADRLTIRGKAYNPVIAAFLSNPAQTYTWLDVNIDVIGGAWQVHPQGTFRHLRIGGSWTGPYTSPGTSNDKAPVYIQADDAVGAAQDVRLERIAVDSGGSAIGYVAIIGRATAAAALADNTYSGLVVDDVRLDTGGGSSFSPIISVQNNGSASRSLISGREQITNLWRNSAKGAGATRQSGTATVADGGTITHTLPRTPTAYGVTGSVAGQIVTVTAVSATTLTVAVKTGAGAAGTSQTVAWWAEL